MPLGMVAVSPARGNLPWDQAPVVAYHADPDGPVYWFETAAALRHDSERMITARIFLGGDDGFSDKVLKSEDAAKLP